MRVAVCCWCYIFLFFFFQAEDGIRDHCVTGVQTCALPISTWVSSEAIGDCRMRILTTWMYFDNSQVMAEPPWRGRRRGRGRSEERRVGKECRCRGWPEHERKRRANTREQRELE